MTPNFWTCVRWNSILTCFVGTAAFIRRVTGVSHDVSLSAVGRYGPAVKSAKLATPLSCRTVSGDSLWRCRWPCLIWQPQISHHAKSYHARDKEMMIGAEERWHKCWNKEIKNVMPSTWGEVGSCVSPHLGQHPASCIGQQGDATNHLDSTAGHSPWGTNHHHVTAWRCWQLRQSCLNVTRITSDFSDEGAKVKFLLLCLNRRT